ncbi:sensor histidine kinase [Solibaculum mannosilyticum]|uniref:histidine kinase n=1 Tax=Solibaculum mannosilyticum TaxID=2780922 RepID=A0A7I8D3H7_9FIRM|nr:sensor histidine kinase [Solibaculum mannosilyticum]BCI61378.1 histidine kinase [Solibaculum mannosilyticum]
MKRIRRFFVNLKLRNKLLLAFSVFIILPIVTLTLLSTYLTKYIIEKNAMFSATQSFNQVSDFVSYRIDNIIRATNLIANDQLVHSVAERDPNNYPLEEQFENLQKIRHFLTSYENEIDIVTVRLFLDDQMIHSDEDGDILGLESAKDFPWYQSLSGSQVMLYPSMGSDRNGDQTLSAVRAITSFDNYQDIKGYVMAEFPEKIFRDMISKANSIGGSLTYICNDQYELISSTDDGNQDEFFLTPSQMELVSGYSDWAFLKVGNEDVFAKVKAIPSTNWSIVTIIPESGIFRDTHLIQNTMVLFMLFLIGIAYLGAVFVTLSLTKRIDLLASKMNAAQQGNFSKAIVYSNAKDEIGILIQNFNYMIDRIQTLMAEEKIASQRLRSAELMALQSQINPHFLYNTLDMINWMSYEEDKGEEIRTTLRSLSRFYKLSLNKGRTLVSLQDELKHVSLYIQIQNMRLQNSVHLDIRVPEHLQQCGILKITLQPIVENAVLHGIMEKDDPHGTININAKLSGEDLLITVADDGVGIPPDILDTLLNEEDTSRQHGYGLTNINERIMLYFGEKYGLSIRSQLAKGTIVTIRIPFHKFLDEQ